MMRLTTLFCTLILAGTSIAQQLLTPFELNNNETTTYASCIEYYKNLAAVYPEIALREVGDTDIGKPLHLVILSGDGVFDPDSIRATGRTVIFINNGIHPGEPAGIDASMMLARDIVNSEERRGILKKVAIVIIPVYNIGGVLNRGSHSRANQNGPAAYGFRGNAKNLDLNRDFIKCDSRNARSFNQVFTQWSPDVLVDNHTTNGADYPYTITLISTQKDKLERPLADYLTKQLEPALYTSMQKRQWEMSPYVYARTTPDEGIAAFLDLPRYSTGYAALHQTLGFTVETHMLKPFSERVRATYQFMDALLRILQKDADKLLSARANAQLEVRNKKTFNLNWSLDFSKKDSIYFKGYTARYKPSQVTGKQRLYYDQHTPWEGYIPYYKTYTPVDSVEKPVAYIVPQAYRQVLRRLKWNGVKMQPLSKDIDLNTHFYKITDYKTTDFAYEGHYLHSAVKVEQVAREQSFKKGDFVIFTNQRSSRYIVETLEPQAADSYFAWNFFDGILMQKEYFSSYVFEDLAVDILNGNPELKATFEAKKKSDAAFANNARAQLDFIYKNSRYYEPTHNLYPVARLEKPVQLPLKQ